MSRQTEHFYEFGPFRLDPEERLLLREGHPVRLTPKAFEALVVLVERGGRLVGRDELMRALWPDAVVEEGNVDNCVHRLRKAMGGGQDYIETVPKHGYRFVAEVRSLPHAYEEMSVERHMLTRTVREEEVQIEVEAGEAALSTAPGSLVAAGAARAARRALPLALGLLLLGAFAALALLYRPSATTGNARPAAAAVEAASPPRTIAVLPFKIIGAAGGGEEYLGLGMADALITRLGHSRRIVVRPTSAVRRYTDPHQDPVAAGRQQGVEAVLDGSIQRAGDRLRVTARLIDVAGGESIWSGQFDEPFTDIFAVQDSISRRVMSDLLVELNPEEQARLARHGTESAEAYREYLRGRYFWNRRTNENYQKAVEHFNRAIQIDPAYAQAHAGLADALLLLSLGKQETVSEGRAALRKAIELDETLAEPHTTLGLLAMNFDHDWAGAEREYRRAIELNPNDATAHHRYGEFLALLGRFDEGVAEVRRAQELDPLSLIIGADAGIVYTLAREYDRAIEQCQRTLDMDPDYVMARSCLGFAYSLKGRHEEAVAEFQQIEQSADDAAWLLSYQGYIYGAAGRGDDARRMLKRLTVLSKRTYVPPSSMMLVYAGLGEKDEAFEWAERMFGEQDFTVLGLKVNPVFDSLRADPRYQFLLRRAKLN
jgi:DNA-binding winged helix-turn-helix (wHTH) protein/TolB-like protein/Tfp pilus assembly protein PilF